MQGPDQSEEISLLMAGNAFSRTRTWNPLIKSQQAVSTGAGEARVCAKQPERRSANVSNALHLDILPGVTFRVCVTAERPQLRGKPVDGLFNNDAGSITLWAGLAPARRLHVFLHEWWHVKRYYLGAPQADAEADCDTAAGCMASLLLQLEPLGGVEALLALEPS